MDIQKATSKFTKGMQLYFSWQEYLSSSSNRTESYKEFKLWFMSTFVDKNLTKYEIPWLPFPVTKWLQTYLKQDMQIFEWGSGASSLFFSKYANSVTSIEYDRLWFDKVHKFLQEKEVSNVDLRYIAAESIESTAVTTATELNPYQSTLPEYKNRYFVKYTRSILEYPDAYFDLILVDGRARLGCLKASLSKIKDSGIIMLDNSDNQKYQGFMELFDASWKVHHFKGPVPANIWPVFNQTTIFYKQSARANFL